MKKNKNIIVYLKLPLIFLIIAVVGIYLILIANGYILNFQAKKIEPTGMIYLKSEPRNVNIYINGQLKGLKTPIKISELVGGRYDVKISKEGYQDWQKTLKVETGFVSAEDSIVVFLSKPEEVQITDEEIEAFQKLPNQLMKEDIKIVDETEIWIPDPEREKEFILVTRFSQPIKKAAYWSDKKHIIFQINNELRVIDIDGSNNILLLTLTSQEPVDFFVSGNGHYLYCKTAAGLKKYRIH